MKELTLIKVRYKIANNVKNEMKSKGLDLEDLTQIAGIKKIHLMEILDGRRCQLSHLVKLSNALDMDIENLFK